MPRLYLQSIPRDDKHVFITGENARYLLAVLRCRPGDEFTVFNSASGHYRAKVVRAGRNGVMAELLDALPPVVEPVQEVVLLQGLLKGRKMDFVVQKATELGVGAVVPLVTERSQLRRTRKLGRWQKIALEAARQSARARVPDIRELTSMEAFLEHEAKPLRGFIFWEEGGTSMLEERPAAGDGPLYVAVGPEGGFTEREVRRAGESGLLVKSLGKRILRAETAAVSALTIVQFLLGEM